jgi:hypothetical protein
MHTDDTFLPAFDDQIFPSAKFHFWRYNPSSIKLSLRGNGEDLLGDHTFIEYERLNNQNYNITTSNSILFSHTIGTLAPFYSAGVENKNSIFGRGPWGLVGNNSCYDMEICDLEENISEIECLFEIVRDRDGSSILDSVFSGEDKVRMSSITVKFELIE